MCICRWMCGSVCLAAHIPDYPQFICRLTICRDISGDTGDDITKTGCPFLIAILIFWLQNLEEFDDKMISERTIDAKLIV